MYDGFGCSIVHLEEFCLRNTLIIQTAVYSLYLQAMHSFLLLGIFTYIIKLCQKSKQSPPKLSYSFYQQFLYIPSNGIVQELSSFMTKGENYYLIMNCRLFVTVLELFGIGCAALVALGIIILVIAWVCGRTCCSSDSRRRRR